MACGERYLSKFCRFLWDPGREEEGMEGKGRHDLGFKGVGKEGRRRRKKKKKTKAESIDDFFKTLSTK